MSKRKVVCGVQDLHHVSFGSERYLTKLLIKAENR